MSLGRDDLLADGRVVSSGLDVDDAPQNAKSAIFTFAASGKPLKEQATAGFVRERSHAGRREILRIQAVGPRPCMPVRRAIGCFIANLCIFGQAPHI